MISQIKQQGFTIVELLIVIVVIAILAALSYVGYTSITSRAKDSTAQASAKAVKDAAQTFNGVHGSWPASKTEMVNGYPSGGSAADAVAKLPGDITFLPTAPTATSSEKSVYVLPCSSGGMRIQYFKYTAPAEVKTVNVGDTTTCGTTPLS